MVSRRNLFSAGAVGGVLGLMAPAAAAGAAGAAQPLDQRAIEGVSRAIEDLRADLRGERNFTEIGRIREAQKSFLRLNGKLPDFLEVGIDVWYAAYDWHVRWQQAPVLGRDPGGRYTIMMQQTLVIMRPEMEATFLGQPYDAR